MTHDPRRRPEQTSMPEAAARDETPRSPGAPSPEKLGGDRYDALLLPDGATCVVVGDVTGHDVQVAPVMGQIRNMLRALATTAADRPAWWCPSSARP